MATSPRARTLRWFAPLAMVAVIALLAAVPNLSAADTPTLAPVTPQQLIAKVQQVDVRALSGTIALTANLGIPNLGALSDAAGAGGQKGGSAGFNPTDLLSGSHQALVWVDGQDKSRVALLQSMAEVDVVHNGHDVWLWDSTTKKVTHTILAAGTTTKGPTNQTPEPATADPIQTPAQLAQKLLDKIGPSTATSITSTNYVANQPVYQLVLTPKLAASTIAQVVIAVDSNTGLPLQVQVFAKGQNSVALELGFTSIDYTVPAASNFTFTPPPGSTVTTKQPTAHTTKPATPEPLTPATPAKADNPLVVGQDWGTVGIFSGVKLPAQAGEFLKAATPVQGAFGSGKLIESALVNVLVLDDGRIAVGAVTSTALEAAVANAH